MANEQDQDKLLAAPPTKHTSFFSWHGLSDAVNKCSGTIVSTGIIFNAVSTGLQWIFNERGAFNQEYEKNLNEGRRAAQQGEEYTAHTGKIHQPAGISGLGAFGFACAITANTAYAYALGHAAGYNLDTKTRIKVLTAACLSLGINISMNIIADLATGGLNEDAANRGFHNGYVRQLCEEFDCDDLPQNITLPTCGEEGQICDGKLAMPQYGESFFGSLNAMLPLTIVTTLACLLLGYNDGCAKRQSEQLPTRAVLPL